MYIYIHIHIYTEKCICVYMCVYIYIYIYICRSNIYTYGHTYILAAKLKPQRWFSSFC